MQEQHEQSGVNRGSGVPYDEAQRPVLPQLSASEGPLQRTGWSPTAWRTTREPKR